MIIKITKNDYEYQQALNVRKVVFVDEQKVSLEEEIDDLEDVSIHMIGVHKDEVIAASRIRFVDDYGKLERIAIKKDFRGNNFGLQMVRAMEEVIIKNNYHLAKLNAQTYATTFYEKLGYLVVSEEFIDAGIPHVTMTKKLN